MNRRHVSDLICVVSLDEPRHSDPASASANGQAF